MPARYIFAFAPVECGLSRASAPRLTFAEGEVLPPADLSFPLHDAPCVERDECETEECDEIVEPVEGHVEKRAESRNEDPCDRAWAGGWRAT